VVNIGSGQIYKDASGNVGIGTTPIAKLHIVGSGDAGPTSTSGIFRVGDGTGNLSIGFSGNEPYIGSSSNHSLRLITNAVERLRIDSSGNCSIGTATALSKLHVHGDLTLSNATTAVTASTSTITPPATVAGYLTVSINGTSRKIPYYAT
jgi:hypothetical protein